MKTDTLKNKTMGGKLSKLSPVDVFSYFEEICSIPHGSGNMEKISKYCEAFAKDKGFWCYRDGANNVVIKKPASKGYENAAPVILQGHIDMVCQKEDWAKINFETDGLDISEDGEYVFAKGTTLGGDNGIAVAMMLAILGDDTLSHPPIEAVFTTDEEIGMDGAKALDMEVLSGKRMINMDSEDPSVVTVSCAGGSDLTAKIPVKREKKKGAGVTITLKDLKGGHSGVEIHKGRVNAGKLMGRILCHLAKNCDFSIVNITGGDKANAIPANCTACLVTEEAEKLSKAFAEYAEAVKEEIRAMEENFAYEISMGGAETFDAIDKRAQEALIYTLLLAPNGVQEMSAEIEGLVETSLNMGILATEEESIKVSFALRSNKKTALLHLEEKLSLFFKILSCDVKTGGHYPPWEYKEDSVLRSLYIEKYKEKTGKEARVEAIHAGLECGVFADGIKELDCISIGPLLYDIHTPRERMDIKSVKDMYDIVCHMLGALK